MSSFDNTEVQLEKVSDISQVAIFFTPSWLSKAKAGIHLSLRFSRREVINRDDPDRSFHQFQGCLPTCFLGF